MTAFLRKFSCSAALLLLSIWPGSNQALAAIAPDVTTLTSISTALSTPVRLASDTSGALYVSDPRGGGIVKYASNGNYVTTIPAAGTLGVSVAANGELLVSQGTYVAVFSAAGVKRREFGSFGKANGIAVTKTGEIFVVDSQNNNVQAFNADYTARGGNANSFGGVGTSTGKFRQPTGIAYEKEADQLAVTDTRNGRVQFFSVTGAYRKSIGSFGSGPLRFTSPQSVSFEYSSDQSTLKRIYIVDSFQSTIQVIDGVTGEFIRYIGGYGVTDGKLVTPSDILFDTNNRLIVANGTGKLLLFGITDPSTGPFLQLGAMPQVTNISSLAISGTTTGTSVTINGSSASVSGTAWSGSVTLTPGTNLITVVAADAKGSTSRTVSVIALAPAANPVHLTVLPLSPQTSHSALTISGTVTSGATVMVNNVTARITGTDWSAPVTLSSGANVLQISASKSGMSTSTIDLSVILDTTVPIVTTRLPSPESIFSTPLQSITGTVSSSNATTIIVSLNGTRQSVPVSDGTFSIPLVLLPGANSLSVVVVDSYGATTPELVSSVVYNPLAPRITVTSPASAVSGTALYHLAGSAPAGSSVTINGVVNATVNGTDWSADVLLQSGFNGFEVRTTLPAGESATAMTSVAYSQGLPALSITSPAKDSPVATAANTISGIVSTGATVTARVNGVPVSVATSGAGTFTVALPKLEAPGIYTIVVSATDTTSGATSTSTRSLAYEPDPPVITIVSSSSPITVTAPGGVLVAKDKNGPVGTISYAGGIAMLSLPDGTYDQATLNIQVLSPAGLSSRNGDINLDGVVDISDALKALRVLVGLEPQPSFEQMLHGDIGPVVNGEAMTDSRIRMSDIVVIIEKIIGLSR